MQRRTLLKLAALSTIGVPYTKATASPSLSLLPSVHNKESITMNDVIIIGGSFAGLAAALQLGRARRKVIVLDTGLQRNRFAGRSHGMLGHDDKPRPQSWPRRGSNSRATLLSGLSMPAPTASPVPSTISPSLLAMVKP